MSGKIIHKRIATVAKAFADEAFELMASQGVVRHDRAARKLYTSKHWGDYIPFARQALVAILRKDFKFEIAMGQHTEATVQAMKDEIYEALLIDGAFKAPAPIDNPINTIPA